MSKFAYHDYLPENAEVVVDYLLPPNERVEFNYPVKRTFAQSFWHGLYSSYFRTWFVANAYLIWTIMIGAIGFIVGYDLIYIIKQPLDTTINSDPTSLIYTGIILFYIFGVPLLASLFSLRNKLYLTMVPKMNYTCSKITGYLKKKTVNQNEIKDNRYIIPLFRNIYLDWKATEDFGKYLTSVKVIAIPNDFEYLTRKNKIPNKNESDFQAVFTFSQKPQNGNMNIIFD